MQPIVELYGMYAQDVLNYLIFLGADGESAQDLLQETFLKALTGALTFQGRSSVKTWLFSIARHCFLDWLRRSRHTLPLEEKIVLTAAQEEAPFIRQVENAQIIRRGLDALEPLPRKIVIRRSQGYSFGEISRDLCINESSARVVYHRALRRLRGLCAPGE